MHSQSVLLEIHTILSPYSQLNLIFFYKVSKKELPVAVKFKPPLGDPLFGNILVSYIL